MEPIIQKIGVHIACFVACPQAKLELAAERLKEAQGSGKGGRDWLVKELARVVKDASTLKANGLRREHAVLEGHRRVSRESYLQTSRLSKYLVRRTNCGERHPFR